MASPGHNELNITDAQEYFLWKSFQNWHMTQELTHCGIVTLYGILVNIGSGNGLVPDSTKPLPEPMLT